MEVTSVCSLIHSRSFVSNPYSLLTIQPERIPGQKRRQPTLRWNKRKSEKYLYSNRFVCWFVCLFVCLFVGLLVCLHVHIIIINSI